MTAEAEGTITEEISVHFMDVGQGDCTVVVDHRSAQALLIDCPAQGVPRLLADWPSLGNPKLELAMITHWDADHFAGVLQIVEEHGCAQLRYNHDTLIAYANPALPDLRRTPRALATLRHLAGLTATDLQPATDGVSGTMGRVRWELLAPQHRDLTRAIVSSRPNLGSGVVQLTIGEHCVLVGGDAEAPVWERLLALGVRTDVLRWPHHGALRRGGRQGDPVVEARLLNEMAPRLVVVSVGARNGYGHPLPTLTQAVRGSRAHLMCTEATPACDRSHARKECAGTVTIRYTDDGPVIDPSIGTHQALVRTFDSPQCLAPE